VRVLEIFDSLQGEGRWTGAPMTFVRLAGCNAKAAKLECLRWCDTRESWDPRGGCEMSVEEVAAAVRLPRACLTGGEPLLQHDEVGELTKLLCGRGVRVHLETNGTLGISMDELPHWIAVSPKPPWYFVSPNLSAALHELKFVVPPGLLESDDLVRLEQLAARHPRAVVSVQPESSGGAAALDEAIRAVMAHPRWRLSLQLHKLLGLR